DHVEPHEADARQGPNEVERVGGRRTAHLGGSRGRSERRVDEVDVEAEERRAVADAGPHAVGVLGGAEPSELLPPDQLKPELAHVVEVLLAVDGAPHPGQERAGRVHHPLLERSPEGRAVEIALTSVGVPDVGVRVEQDQAGRTVGGGDGPKLGERDQMVASEPERDGAGRGDRLEVGGEAPDRLLVVAGRSPDVPAVDDLERAEHVGVERRVVVTEQDRNRSDRFRAEARAGAKAGAAVEGDADDGDVDALQLGREGPAGEGANSAEAGRCVLGGAHSRTTLMVLSVRSLAPRTRPPWARESATYASVGPVRRSPGSTFGTPGG